MGGRRGARSYHSVVGISAAGGATALAAATPDSSACISAGFFPFTGTGDTLSVSKPNPDSNQLSHSRDLSERGTRSGRQ